MDLKSLDRLLNKPKLDDFYACFSQLYMLMNSGSTLKQALSDIAPDQRNPYLGAALKNISRNLDSGISIGTAIRKESLFPRLVAPTVEAGDRAGELSQTFFRLSELMWLQHNLYSKVQNALFVPKIAAVLMSVMAIAYIKIAIPEYVKLYHDNNIEIPGIVSIVSNGVNAIVDYWYITLLVIFLGYKLWGWFAGTHVALVDHWKLKIPIYNRLHFFFLQHQMASCMSLMLSSGLTVPDSLIQASKVVDNSIMAHAITRVKDDLIRGNTLAKSIKRNNGDKTFDAMLIASVNAGELSDHLPQALEQNCKYYERALINMIEPVSTKITFIVMIPMGLLIVMMFAFTMIPMFSYISQIMQY